MVTGYLTGTVANRYSLSFSIYPFSTTLLIPGQSSTSWSAPSLVARGAALCVAASPFPRDVECFGSSEEAESISGMPWRKSPKKTHNSVAPSGSVRARSVQNSPSSVHSGGSPLLGSRGSKRPILCRSILCGWPGLLLAVQRKGTLLFTFLCVFSGYGGSLIMSPCLLKSPLVHDASISF